MFSKGISANSFYERIGLNYVRTTGLSKFLTLYPNLNLQLIRIPYVYIYMRDYEMFLLELGLGLLVNGVLFSLTVINVGYRRVDKHYQLDHILHLIIILLV